MKNIVLIGFMGSGKSTIAALLAAETGLPIFDLDQEIVKAIGMPITEYFASNGEEAFRKIESQKLAEALQTEGIIATGGGIIVAEDNRPLLQQHPTVVYLQTEPTQLVTRIRQDTRNQRPLADDKTDAEILQLLQGRVHHYEESASWIIDTTEKDPRVIVAEILAKVGKL